MTNTRWLLDLVEGATPGPWTVGTYEVFSHSSKAPLKRIAFVHEWMNVSDVRLIALAPDLARLCVEMANWIDGVGGMDEGKKLLARFEELKP